jgi:hypothetical protein
MEQVGWQMERAYASLSRENQRGSAARETFYQEEKDALSIMPRRMRGGRYLLSSLRG